MSDRRGGAMGGVSKASAPWRIAVAGAGLVGLAVSCGGDPEPERTGQTDQSWTVCESSGFVTLLVSPAGSSDTESVPSGSLVGLPTFIGINWQQIAVTGDIEAELTWSQDGTAYECEYKGGSGATRLMRDTCTPGLPPGDATSPGPPIETGSLTLTLTAWDVGSRRVTALFEGLGPEPGCAASSCTPVTEGTECVDSSPCDGLGTCSPAGRCLDGALPPDPDADLCTLDGCTECSELDRTVATYVPSAYAFLYEGAHPVQTGLDPQDLQPERVSVVRGRVLDRAGEPIHGAEVTILPLDPSEPEFGQTHTLSDGHYQMVTHGGGEVTVKIEHPDYLPVLRRDLVLPNDARHFGNVVLTQPAPEDETALDLDDIENGSNIVVAMGSLIDDDVRGDRQAFVMFKPGTTAWLVDHPSVDAGTTTQLEGELTFHATEFTTGAEGMLAMPATLPPTSGYTYAISYGFSGVPADQHVKFSQPVSAFVEVTEFLDFDTGSPIPLGWLDMTTGAWVADESGEVIEVTGTETCGAETCATIAGASVALPDPERVLLAGYSTGTKLWRFEIDHFSYFDKNCGLAPPSDATTPNLDPTAHGPNDNPNCRSGSEIECESMVLGESLPLVGTPLTLHYRTDRVEGRRSEIRISLDYDHEELTDADVSLYVAGTYQHEMYDLPLPAEHVFTWDQRDFLGRLVQGAQKAIVEVGLWYNGTYADTPAFNLPPQTGGTTVGTKVRLYRRWIVDLGHFTAEPLELGGWTLGQHHFYDPNERKLYYGDGRRKTADAKSGQVVRSVLGGTSQSCGMGGLDDDTDPLQVALSATEALAAGPDGSLYVADSLGDCRGIRRVTPSGDHTLEWSENDDAPGAISGLARGPDGSLYIARGHLSGTQNALRVDRLKPGASSPELFAGDGNPCPTSGSDCGDGDDATEAQLARPQGLAVTPDGSVYITDPVARRIRRVDPSGKIWTIAGNGTSGCTDPPCGGSEGDLATDVGIGSVAGLALMGDGTVVFESGSRVLAVTTDGRIWRVAGSGNTPFSSAVDGIPANALDVLPTVDGLAAMPDGRLLIALSDRVLAVRPPIAAPMGEPNGSYTTVAGAHASQSCNGFTDCGDGFAPTAADFTIGNAKQPIAVAPDGRIFITEGNYRVFAIEPLLPDFGVAWQIPSEDATELYLFDESGRHLETVDGRTGTPLFSFGYNKGLVVTVTDLNGLVTEITRSENILIEGPFGKITNVKLDGADYASRVTTPGGRVWDFVYDDDPPGLMLEMETPRGHDYFFTHDTAGRLTSDADPAGGFQTLDFTQLQATSTSPFGYEVEHWRNNTATTSLDATGYRLQSAEGAVTHRAVTWPLGDTDELVTTTTEVGDIETTTTSPDGTVVTITRLPEQRWGMLAPMTTVEISSGGVSSVASLDRTVALTDPSDPLTLETLIETVTVDGKVWEAELDLTAGPVTYEVTSPELRTLDVELDGLMRATKLTMPAVDPVIVTYHASGTHKGLIDKIEQGAGGAKRTLDFTYNSESELWKVLDPELREVVFTYDNDELVMSATLPDTSAISFDYNQNGELSEVQPPSPSSDVHELNYTSLGFLSSYTPPPPATGAPGWTYTPDRKLNVFTSPVATIDAAYDAYGRLEELYHAVDPVTVDYYPLSDATRPGKVSEIAASYDGTALAFDYAGALLDEVALTGPVEATVSWEYGTGFVVDTETVTANGTPHDVDYAYDDDGLLEQAGALTIERDPSGNKNGLLWKTTLGAVTDTYTYSSFGELSHYQAKFDGTDNLYEVYYERDKLGRVIRRAERVLTGSVEVREYEYHDRGWLEEVLVGTVSSCTLATCNCGDEVTCVVGEAYTYDLNGNRETASGSLVTAVVDADTVYDAQDRQTMYGAADFLPDAAGQRDEKEVGSDTWLYTYSPYGELREIQGPAYTVTYVLDPFGQRVGKKVGGFLEQAWVWGAELGPVAELADDGETLVARYVYGTRSWVPDYIDAGANDYRIITDELGSVRLVVNATSGAVVQELAYDSFGNVLDDTSPGFQPFGFAGGMVDPDTGLVRFGVRDYDPVVGRWTQKDPILLAGGVNLYEYAAGDPVNNIDPTGLIVETGWDIVNVGLSAAALAGDIECGSAGDIALSGAGLGYDILAVAVPGLPAGAGALGKLHRHHTIPREILKKHLPKDVAKAVQGKKGAPNKWPIPEDLHKAIHKGKGGGQYNEDFKDALKKLENPTDKDVKEIRDELVKKYGIDKYRPYK